MPWFYVDDIFVDPSKIFFLAVVSDFGQKMHSAGTRNKPHDFNLNHDQ